MQSKRLLVLFRTYDVRGICCPSLNPAGYGRLVSKCISYCISLYLPSIALFIIANSLSSCNIHHAPSQPPFTQLSFFVPRCLEREPNFTLLATILGASRITLFLT